MSTCLYIGRFQPIHIGHLDVINQVFDHGYGKIILGVGSSNKSDERNPWTFPQRKEMIEVALQDRGLDTGRFDIVGIPDFSDDEDWLSYINETISFDVVMSGNEQVIGIFQQHDQQVLDELERIPIHSTQIRAMLAENQWEEIQKWVTPSVYGNLKTTL